MFACPGWKVNFLHIARGGGGFLGGGNGGQIGTILTRESPESTPNSPVLTQISPGLPEKARDRPMVDSGEHGEGFFVQGRCWGMVFW